MQVYSEISSDVKVTNLGMIEQDNMVMCWLQVINRIDAELSIRINMKFRFKFTTSEGQNQIIGTLYLNDTVDQLINEDLEQIKIFHTGQAQHYVKYLKKSGILTN